MLVIFLQSLNKEINKQTYILKKKSLNKPARKSSIYDTLVLLFYLNTYFNVLFELTMKRLK